MKTLKFLVFVLLALSMGMTCSDDDAPGQKTDNLEEPNSLKNKLLGEWVILDPKDSYIYTFADNDTIYVKTRESETISKWPYQAISEDSIQIIRNWTTHNKVIFYSNDSIWIGDFMPAENLVFPANVLLSEFPDFFDIVLKRLLNDEILPACTTRTDDVSHYLTDHKTTILKEFPQYGQGPSSYIVIAKLFDDTEPTAYLVVENFSTHRICNYPQYAKEWDIPENGLPVVLSGKVYPPSFNPGFHPDNRAFFDLELTILKSELQ